MATLDNPLGLPSSGLPDDRMGRLIREFLRGRTPDTLRVYGHALDDFGDFAGVGDRSSAARKLLTLSQGEANALVLDYRHSLEERKLSPATVNLRLSALRSLVKLARTLGVVNFTLDVQSLEAQSYRDTRGPGEDGFKALLLACKNNRDRAILHLLYLLALRRTEVSRLDFEDLDLAGDRIQVLGKKRKQKEWLSIPIGVKTALEVWLQERGSEPGPLFGAHGKRLQGIAIYRLVLRVAKRAGIKARPHGLRHAAITTALDATNGDVRAVRAFARLRRLETLLVYDDHRVDAGKGVAEKLDERLSRQEPNAAGDANWSGKA